MCAHGYHLGNDRLVRPVDPKDFCEFLEVLCGSLTDREDCVTQPAHAEIAELFIEKLDAELACKKGYVFDDSQAHAPLLVLSQLHNGGQKRL